MTTLASPLAHKPGRDSTRPKLSRRRRSLTRPSLPLTVLAILVAVIFILPAVWILVGSLRPTEEIFGSLSPLSWRLIIPASVSFRNYSALVTGGFGQALLNSLIVCLGTVALGMALCTLSSYALAVLHFPGRSVVFSFVVISFMVPFEAIAIPLSQLFTEWGLANTLTGLILPGIGNGLAIFNLRQFFMGIPPSFREAAMIDGAAEPRILWSIYLPMSGAALTNSALLIFLGQWTSYLWPLLVVSDSNLQVAPVALAKTFSEHSFDFGQNFAGAVILSLIPAVLMFFLQRFFGSLSVSSGEK